MSDNKYSLYVGRYQEISEGVKYSYLDMSRGYLFVLADRKPEGKFAELDPEKVYDEMTEREKDWYNHSCLEINVEWVKEHPEETEQLALDFLDSFEKELKAELDKKARENTVE